ncbi:MAG: ATP-binding cassette domain-containing protein, partial [Clostridium sp.]|nr:ATP-binding cassette domain-containing protein [Clostridium sp.]
MKEKKLQAINLTKKIGGRTIINDLSFEIEEGDICGFLGPNGSGKTTTIRMITGLISPTKGEILISGNNVAKDRRTALI